MMTRNQYVLFSIISILIFIVSGCTPTYKLTDGTAITKKEIIAEIQAYKEAKSASSYYNSKKVRIRNSTMEKTEKSDPLFKSINKLKIDKLSKAKEVGSKTIFYMKTGNDLKRYYKPDHINIFQPNITNDNLFDEEIDRIINLLESGTIEMSEIKENLNKEYGIAVQYLGSTSFVAEDKFKAEVIEVLKNEKALSVYKTEKAKSDRVTYLSLIQNLGFKKDNPLCHYLTITLK